MQELEKMRINEQLDRIAMLQLECEKAMVRRPREVLAIEADIDDALRTLRELHRRIRTEA